MRARNIYPILLAFFTLIGSAFTETYLVSFDSDAGRNIPVVKIIGNKMLAVGDDGLVQRLSRAGMQFKILDTDPAAHLYFLIYPYGETIDNIARHGTILESYEDCILLKTTEEEIIALNRLKVELNRITLKSVVREPIIPAPQKYNLFVDTLVQAMVAAVSQDSIGSSDLRMQRMYTRYATTDSNRITAVNWIRNRLLAYGCDSVYFDTFSGSYGANVVGVKLGLLYPVYNRYCVIDGHMDDVPSSGYAPGADDNATGTIAMLEAARVMKDYYFENTIKFIAFNAEEQGLVGSDAFAANAYSNGDTILGVLNFDMIGYVTTINRDSLNTHYTTAVPGCSVFVVNFFQAVADTYTQLKIRRVRNTGTSGSSDHASFWQYGYKALLGIERELTPEYHTTGDTIGPYMYTNCGVNNLPFATKVIQTGTAALAILAVPIHTGLGWPEIPTIVKPFNYVRTPDLQPTLEFFSNDPNGDGIEYRVLWDTDPGFATPESTTTAIFPSGTIVSFTFPSPLSNGETYWWKLKCTDPGGSDAWTEYTESRSLTIGTSLPANTCSWYQTTNAQFLADLTSGTMIQGDSVVLQQVGYIEDTLLSENFEAGSIPAGWTVIDGNSDGYMWTVGTTSDIGTYAPPNYGTRYAFYSDDDPPGTISYNEELISPRIFIPATATNLLIDYGYGFRVWETGEKYRVKFRKKTGGTWTPWSNIAEYTTSTSGTASIDLTVSLPADSVQFEWFFSDSTSASHDGWACACDNVNVIYSFDFQNTSGTVTGTPVLYHDLSIVYPRSKWGDVVWHKSTGGDSIGIQVEYYNGASWQLVPNTLIPSNSIGNFSTIAIDTLSLSNVTDTITYNTLRLKGSFYKIGKSPELPAMLDWEVGNLANEVAVVENQAGKRIVSFDVFPNPFNRKLDIRYSMLDAGCKAKSISLKIYDVTGRTVKDLTNNLVSSIKNQALALSWSGSDDMGRSVPAGVYFIQLEVDGSELIEKTVLLR